MGQHQQVEQVQFVCVYARDRWILGMSVETGVCNTSKNIHPQIITMWQADVINHPNRIFHLPSDHSDPFKIAVFPMIYPWESCHARACRAIDSERLDLFLISCGAAAT